MRVLGIESSCDETGIALYDSEKGLLAHALYSQIALHAEYGGVVPELASRDHIRKTLPLIDEVLDKAKKDKELKTICEKVSEANKLLNQAIDFVNSNKSSDNGEAILHLYEGRLRQIVHDTFSCVLLLEQAIVSDRKKHVAKVYATEILSRVKMWQDQVLDGSIDIVEHFKVLTEAEFD